MNFTDIMNITWVVCIIHNVKKRFDKEGIEIPYPHVKVVKDKK